MSEDISPVSDEELRLASRLLELVRSTQAADAWGEDDVLRDPQAAEEMTRIRRRLVGAGPEVRGRRD